MCHAHVYPVTDFEFANGTACCFNFGDGLHACFELGKGKTLVVMRTGRVFLMQNCRFGADAHQAINRANAHVSLAHHSQFELLQLHPTLGGEYDAPRHWPSSR